MVPSERQHGNVMGDNWRLEWGTAALVVFNAQRCGCWPVKADFKLASVSWKKTSYLPFALQLLKKYCLFNWMITSEPDGGFLLSVCSLYKLEEVICKFLFVYFIYVFIYLFCRNGAFLFSFRISLAFQQLRCLILSTSVSCLSERSHFIFFFKKSGSFYRTCRSDSVFFFAIKSCGASFVTTSCRCCVSVTAVLIEHVAHNDCS